MAAKPSDEPLSPQAVDRAIALLREGWQCKTKWRLWSYIKQEDCYWRAEQILRDNEWTGRNMTEQELREEIAQHPAAFRQMLVDAL